MRNLGDTDTYLDLIIRAQADALVVADNGSTGDAVVYFTTGKTDIFTMSASVQRGSVVNR